MRDDQVSTSSASSTNGLLVKQHSFHASNRIRTRLSARAKQDTSGTDTTKKQTYPNFQ